MAISLLPLSIIVACLFHFSSGKEICCEHLGCFTNQKPFDHMYLPECPVRMEMEFVLYNKGGHKGTVTRNNIPNHFDPKARTVFIIHGWRNSGTTSWVIEMKDALLSRDNLNVIVVDWEKGAGHLMYPYSAANVRTVGAETAEIMDMLVDKVSTSYGNLWCVGFSLGAHACGHVGMKTKSLIGRVTGLDPAGPKFDSYDVMAGLNPSAAEYVDAIHTDGYGLAAYYGSLRPVAHADFYPNEGWYQPGCWTYYSKDVASRLKERPRILSELEITENPYDDMVSLYGVSCSHSRAPDLFIASVQNEGCFAARHDCTDERKLPGSCTSCSASGICNLMGYGSDGTKRGKFYLKTSNRAPFCMW